MKFDSIFRNLQTIDFGDHYYHKKERECKEFVDNVLIEFRYDDFFPDKLTTVRIEQRF